jgi:hypothetical protein
MSWAERRADQRELSFIRETVANTVATVITSAVDRLEDERQIRELSLTSSFSRSRRGG